MAEVTNHLPSRLVIETGAEEGMIYPLRETVVSIGRGPENTIQIIDTRMSRRHSMLILNDDRWFLRDLGSKNGTFVNGEVVEGDQSLSPGDRLVIGDTVFIFEQDRAPRAGGTETSGVRLASDSGDITPSQIIKISSGEGGMESTPTQGREVNKAGQDQHLRLIYQVADIISSTLDSGEVLERILNLIQRTMRPDRCGILLYDEKRQALLPTVVRRPNHSTEDIVISESIVNSAVKQLAAVLVADAPDDTRFKASESIVRHQIRSAICAPLVDKDDVLGVIYLDRRGISASFDQDDLRLVAGIANQSSLAIANARLHQRLMKQYAQERELEIARSIQEHLLPSRMPDLPGLDVFGVSNPARMVGGDYYDLIELPDGRLLVAIADVSGKGVPAAILLAEVRTALQVEVSHATNLDLIRIMNRLNSLLVRDAAQNMYVTMVLSIFDPIEQTLTFCNAGHVYPLLCHPDGRVEPLDEGGLFLGILPEVDYEQGKTMLEPGSVLMLYSDGVTDTMNDEGELFGLQRLTDLVVSLRGKAPQDICQEVLKRTQVFSSDNEEQFDDLTMLVLKTRER